MKHAYLILAHNEFDVLRLLIQAIDDPRNDIYIHFDKKLKELPLLKSEFAKIRYIDNRVNVSWGDLSVVEAEYALFETATKEGEYAYYHLLSGVDMPLCSQDDIHRFFDLYQGKEFIGFSQGDMNAHIARKVQRYHLFPKDFKVSVSVGGFFKRAIRYVALRIQYLFGIYRNKGINFKKGTQWVSLTHDFVLYILQNKNEVMETYHHTFCADEIFVQTLCWNSHFVQNIYHLSDEGYGSMRMIGWKNNKLPAWKVEDLDVLLSSKAMFARKFSTEHIEVAEKILRKIEMEKECLNK
ncbi:beta-1,6-N-acetylglucosaminyltransferase [Albibacterium indicum]|uniref:beta-1,6-N-acetylglucosaminyltransferase n=1 Tax=Albibacterium indicum TaxID=2292082 RepID=UPI000E477C07|nr:beta-1,6-N-acetylglucosaminyltransferase [Pedobacter indicus]